jgi:hypothetical protein
MRQPFYCRSTQLYGRIQIVFQNIDSSHRHALKLSLKCQIFVVTFRKKRNENETFSRNRKFSRNEISRKFPHFRFSRKWKKRFRFNPTWISWWGEGKGGCFICSPEDVLNKNVSCAYIIIKSTLKMAFLLQTPEIKSLLRYLARHFLFLKDIWLKASWTYFGSK